MDIEKVENEQRARMFETQFDGDEIDGKFYPLNGGVTGLDAPTSEYLLKTGRLVEVTDAEYFANLPGPKSDEDTGDGKAPKTPKVETDEEREAREAREAEAEALKPYFAAAEADFDAKRIPDDLIDADKPDSDADRLISAKKLGEVATAEELTVKGSKRDVAIQIMAARAKAEAEAPKT